MVSKMWADEGIGPYNRGGDGLKNKHIPLQNGPIAALRRVIQYF